MRGEGRGEPLPSGQYDAILLTGGRARRMGGADKAALVVGGRTMAQRAADAVPDASRLIVVGPWTVDIGRAVIVTREEPAGGGPVAAIAAGAAYVTAPEVAVLAVDQPFVTVATVAALRGRLDGDVAFPVDPDGRDQPLCSVWRTAALRAALAAVADPADLPVRRLVDAAATVARVEGLGRGGDPPPWFDCDTPGDLAQAERWT